MTPSKSVPQERYWGGLKLTWPRRRGSGITTIADCELERRQTSFKALGAIREALERSGVEFTFGKQPGVRLWKR